MAEVLDPASIEDRLRGLGSCYTVATGKKRQVIDAYLGLSRSEEELEMLKNEAKNILYYYEEKTRCILAKLADLSKSVDPFSRGASAMLKQMFTRNDILLRQAQVLNDAMAKKIGTTAPFNCDSDDDDDSDCSDSDSDYDDKADFVV